MVNIYIYMNLENTTDENKNTNTFIFTYVRMNPPTPGHLSLIKYMIDKAIELGQKNVYVITSSSLDDSNPLPCSNDTIPKNGKTKSGKSILEKITKKKDNNDNITYKSEILNTIIESYKKRLIDSETDDKKKNLISDVNVNVMCSVGTPFVFINSLIKKEFTDKGINEINMFCVVGSDRASFMNTINENFIQYDNVLTAEGVALPREGMESLKTEGLGKRSISDINVNEYSASFVRNLVRNNKKDDFTQVYQDYLPVDIINQLYDAIKMGVETQVLKASKGKRNADADADNSTRKKTRLGGGNKTKKWRRAKMGKLRQKISQRRKSRRSRKQGNMGTTGKQRRTRKHRKSKRYT